MHGARNGKWLNHGSSNDSENHFDSVRSVTIFLDCSWVIIAVNLASLGFSFSSIYLNVLTSLMVPIMFIFISSNSSAGIQNSR